MKKLVRVAALSVMALSLTGGVAAAHSGTIDTTGPNSTNKIEHEQRHETRVENDNYLFAVNYNPQKARTGRAEVRHNTTGGDARSGHATNDSTFDALVEVDNSASVDAATSGNGAGTNSATVRNTGPKSYNKVEFEYKSEVKVENKNVVGVLNVNEQKARSGDAKVKGNTTGGDAVSGNASNTSNNITTIRITN